MKQIQYEAVREVYDCGSGTRVSYGIRAYEDAGNGMPARMIAAAHDVSADKEQMEGLVGRCNRGGLSPDHLYDVIEDFLGL